VAANGLNGAFKGGGARFGCGLVNGAASRWSAFTSAWRLRGQNVAVRLIRD
jgi:hypothetical protein